MMKNYLLFFAVLAAMILAVGCGGDDSSSRDGNFSSADSSLCSYGTYECIDNDSYFCGYGYGYDLALRLSQTCNNGCDYSTGKCSSSSNEGNSGENSSGEDSIGDNSDGNSGESSASECSPGQYKCEGNYSFYCYGGSWGYYDDCATAGCNHGTGQCNSGGGDDVGGGSGAGNECTLSDQPMCADVFTYKYCDNGYWKMCACNGTCIQGYCNTPDSSCDAYCDGSNEYKCENSHLYQCWGLWKYYGDCQYGCNASLNGCNSNSGGGGSGGGSSGGGDSSSKSPCPPKMTGSVSSSTVKLSWSYSTSSGCGTPTTTTLKYYIADLDTWDEVKSSSSSSFTSYSLGITGYGSYDSSAGQWLLKAGIIVQNEAGASSATCVCFIDDKKCSCY